MGGSALRKVTNNEGEIRQWAARHDAHPIERAPFRPDGEPAQLGFVFGRPDGSEASLRPIDWSRFFALFHLMGLVLAFDGDHEFELLKIEGGNNGQVHASRMN